MFLRFSHVKGNHLELPTILFMSFAIVDLLEVVEALDEFALKSLSNVLLASLQSFPFSFSFLITLFILGRPLSFILTGSVLLILDPVLLLWAAGRMLLPIVLSVSSWPCSVLGSPSFSLVFQLPRIPKVLKGEFGGVSPFTKSHRFQWLLGGDSGSEPTSDHPLQLFGERPSTSSPPSSTSIHSSPCSATLRSSASRPLMPISSKPGPLALCCPILCLFDFWMKLHSPPLSDPDPIRNSARRLRSVVPCLMLPSPALWLAAALFCTMKCTKEGPFEACEPFRAKAAMLQVDARQHLPNKTKTGSSYLDWACYGPSPGKEWPPCWA